MRRRDFLRAGAAAAGYAFVSASPFERAAAARIDRPARGGPGRYGPLQAADANGIELPAGFTSRVVARGGQVVPGTGYTWHRAPDGGETFADGSGWIYVSNAELMFDGGVSALRFDANANVVGAYSICSGTRRNCSGGKTPWGTWLSCGETRRGQVWECDPTGAADPIVRPALGAFMHEAVAVDPVSRRLYLTEDRGNGRFYRFTPEVWGDLGAGLLEVAAVDAEGHVTWHAVPNPNPNGVQTPTRRQVPQSPPFAGGEGIVYERGHVYFTTKGDNRVWDLDTRSQKLYVLYDAALDPATQLTGVDNITASHGDLIVAEDGGNMELVLITPNLVASPLLRVVGQSGSELAGPAFDPSGRRLYVSSQRGDGDGITYEISGPFLRVGGC